MIRPASPPELASRRLRAFGALIFVFVLAFALAQTWMHSLESKGPLVVGRSVSGGTGTIRPATPTPAIILPSHAPLSGSSEWSFALPAGAGVPALGNGGHDFFAVGNNGQFIAVVYYINPVNPTWHMNVYRSSDGQLLQSVVFPANTNNVFMRAARDADVIGVTYLVRTASSCTTQNPSTLYVAKYTSTSLVFTDSFPPGCPGASFGTYFSTQGDMIAGYRNPAPPIDGIPHPTRRARPMCCFPGPGVFMALI